MYSLMPYNSSINYIPNNFSYNMGKIATTTISTITVQSVPLENRPPIMATFISLYTLIFFFGITGNALVICK